MSVEFFREFSEKSATYCMDVNFAKAHVLGLIHYILEARELIEDGQKKKIPRHLVALECPSNLAANIKAVYLMERLLEPKMRLPPAQLSRFSGDHVGYRKDTVLWTNPTVAYMNVKVSSSTINLEVDDDVEELTVRIWVAE